MICVVSNNSRTFTLEPDTDSPIVDFHKEISIIRYKSNYQYEHNTILNKFKKNILKRKDRFGCVDVKSIEDDIYVMFGKVGDKSIRYPIYDNNDYLSAIKRYKLPPFIVNTCHVNHFSDNKNLLNLLIFGGGNISYDTIIATYRKLFDINNFKQLEFDKNDLKEMCRKKFRHHLFDIVFDPMSKNEFGNVHLAKYKSGRKKIIDSNADQIKKILEDPQIKINEFESYISVTLECLDKSYDVRFRISHRGNIKMKLPKISWPESILNDDYKLEVEYYNLLKRTYDNIINDASYKEPPRHGLKPDQKTFDNYGLLERYF